MRECKKCGGSFVESEFQLTYVRGQIGVRRHVCRRCRNNRKNELYAIAPEKGRAKGLANYYKNKQRYHDHVKAWDAANPEKVKERRRRADLKRRGNERRRKLKTEAAKRRRWKNPEPSRRDWMNRHLRLKGVTVTDLTIEQWRERLEEFDYHCAYCWASDVVLTKDHLIPISNGGHHTIDNVVPACKPCNSRKRNRSMLEVLKLVS